MIEFEKNIKKILPYDRHQYFEFLDNDSDSPTNWNSVSFLSSKNEGRYGLIECADAYEYLVKNIVSKFNDDSLWIVNHDNKDLVWFPNDENNLTHLRTFFKQREMPNTYKGALIFTKDDLFEFSKDLVSYPYSVFNKKYLLYNNLDISHHRLPFIIKIYSDFCIDLLSTDKILLKEIIDQCSQSPFIIKQYGVIL